ncbi:hypothetical protein ACRS6B_19835 [Nocardia asteroides]
MSEPWPPDMPHVWMPDPARIPAEFTFSKRLEAAYRDLPSYFLENWMAFGSATEVELPETGPVMEVEEENRSGIPNYASVSERLRLSFTRLQQNTSAALERVAESPELAAAAKLVLADVINALTQNAETIPATTLDEHILVSMDIAIANAAEAMEHAHAAQAEVGAGMMSMRTSWRNSGGCWRSREPPNKKCKDSSTRSSPPARRIPACQA